MISGPVSEAEAYNCMREFEENYPFRNFGIVSRSIEVEDTDY